MDTSMLAAGLAALVASYLLGSLSFAVLITRWMGLADPRGYGSKNPGATNVLRSGNKKAAILTLLFDALKGVVPVVLARQAVGAGVLTETWVAWIGVAAFFGHLYPIFFRFQGGKGVATAAGVVLAFNPLLGLATLASFAIIVYFSRYVSLASMVASVFAPFYLVMGNGVAWREPQSAAVALFVMAAWLVWRHRENVNRLLKGTESKLGAKK
jgi:acyl phosphate:glycerol-3-phosphate acyltransferase